MLQLVDQEPRTVHVEHCMGTVFSIDIRDGGSWSAAVGDVVTWLHRVDAIFSTYREDSDIARLNTGASVADLDPSVGTVLALAAEAERLTGGWFTTRWGSGIDPTGIVKGWAIERASELLRAHGSRNHAVNGGGDVHVAGESAPGQPWRIGIIDPLDRSRVVGVVTGRDFAVATSGTAERGQHIIDPFTALPASSLLSLSVTGPSLTRADACATAAFAMGRSGLEWVHGLKGYEALAVSHDRAAHRTPGWPSSARPTSGRLRGQ